jgi:hypothetical protein
MTADPSRHVAASSVPREARSARPAARSARPAVFIALAVLLFAGCASGGSGAPTAPSATGAAFVAPTGSSAAAITSAAPTVVPATPAPTVAPTPAASSSPLASVAGAASIGSPFYGYALALPAGWSPRPAAQAWDGSARIDSNGPYVDRATGPGSKLFFVYAAPTDLDLAAYAAQGQKDVNAWHSCPATAESATDVTIGGESGRLHAFHCQGLYVMKAFTVRDGFGWVLNQIGPPKQEAADTAAFTAMLAGVDLSK